MIVDLSHIEMTPELMQEAALKLREKIQQANATVQNTPEVNAILREYAEDLKRIGRPAARAKLKERMHAEKLRRAESG
ncbi:MAG: hypothetical protein U0Y68_15555 [Blastocatellia bacterium]